MERVATPVFETPVQWLRVGDLQLHLFLDESGQAPTRHHIGLTIDDFSGAYDALRARASDEWGSRLVQLPSGQVQLYFPDPAGNIVELDWPAPGPPHRSRYPELRRLADYVPQTSESERAVLFLDESVAGRSAPRAPGAPGRGRGSW